MFVNTLYRPNSTKIEVTLNTSEESRTLLGPYCLIIGDSMIHLTEDEASRLCFQITTAIGDLDSLKRQTA